MSNHHEQRARAYMHASQLARVVVSLTVHDDGADSIETFPTVLAAWDRNGNPAHPGPGTQERLAALVWDTAPGADGPVEMRMPGSGPARRVERLDCPQCVGGWTRDDQPCPGDCVDGHLYQPKRHEGAA